MTGRIYLDWVLLAVSLFNALLLLWLGLTVFLNADRRGPGIWLSSAGLLLGSVFFTSHSAILVNGINEITQGLIFWWYMSWISVVSLPFIWYVAVLWYAGYWDHPDKNSSIRSELNQRQHKWFVLIILSGLILIGLLIFTNLLPQLNDLFFGQIEFVPTIASITALTLFYLLCISLSIDAIRHAEKSKRLMGELAQARARRWLMATSVILLAVSVIVGGVMSWIVWEGYLHTQQIAAFGWIDLGIMIMIGTSILLLGQAIVSYEVFTGKTLPRRGLSQYWRRAVILSAGFSLLISGSIVIRLHPIYSMLLSVLVMITFLALLGWRSFSERERLINSLRPFATSQNYFDTLLNESNAPTGQRREDQIEVPFQELCKHVLEAEKAGLFPYGHMALLAGKPAFFPQGLKFYPQDLTDFAKRLQDGESHGFSLELGEIESVTYAVPLWREEGLCGVLLLGQKSGGRPYTQEEIEIAQATGERLIDARASAELIRRLILIQRRHTTTSQVVDQRVRRQLHDEILPQVHASMLELVSHGDALIEVETTLGLLESIHQKLSSLLVSMPAAAVPEVEEYGLVGALRKLLESNMATAFDQIDFYIEPEIDYKTRDLPPMVAEVIYSAVREGVRNAARYGRGMNDRSRLCLNICISTGPGDCLRITLEDNGVGIENGLSKTERSSTPDDLAIESSGQGLSLHTTLMAIIGGSLSVSSRPGQYTRLSLDLPEAAWDNGFRPA